MSVFETTKIFLISNYLKEYLIHVQKNAFKSVCDWILFQRYFPLHYFQLHIVNTHFSNRSHAAISAPLSMLMLSPLSFPLYILPILQRPIEDPGKTLSEYPSPLPLCPMARIGLSLSYTSTELYLYLHPLKYLLQSFFWYGCLSTVNFLRAGILSSWVFIVSIATSTMSLTL